MGNSPRDCGPGGQWLGFIGIRWGIVLMGSCPRTLYNGLGMSEQGTRSRSAVEYVYVYTCSYCA